MLTAATSVAVRRPHRRADRRDARLALLDALDPAAADRARPTAPGRPIRARAAAAPPRARSSAGRAATAATRTQRRCVALADEQLHALAGVVAQRGRAPAGPARRAGTRRRRRRPSADQLETEAEPSVGVAAQQPVLLERDRQAVRRRPRQAGRVPAARPRSAGRSARRRAATPTALSSTPTSAYAVHIARTAISDM